MPSAASEKETRRSPWRDNVEAMTMAVIMALLLKYFVVEAYKIPTGSMQPTLIGDERSGIFDRILVDKLSYAFRDPCRWEVVVFRYPLDRSKNFVKRVVGVGPEQLEIRLGDLWHRRDDSEDWRILRRPRSVQDAMWKPLDAERPDDPSWTPFDAGARDWTFDARSVRARGSGKARWRPGRGAIRDGYYDGYPEGLRELMHGDHGSSGANYVGDLRVDGLVDVLPGTREVVFELDEDDNRYVFRVPGPAAPAGAQPRIDTSLVSRGDGAEHTLAAANEPFRLEPGREVRVRVQNLDDLLELEIDGEVVCAAEIERSYTQIASAYLGVDGAGADFSGLQVYRDVYYTASSAKSARVTIPANEYYMLGDNTQDSSDSREWIYAVYQVSDEDGDARTLRGSQRRGENPITFGYGDPGGATLLFRDEWGERHWLAQREVTRLTPETAPFVPREMIQGRALAVFWPIKPHRGIYRLEWVN